MKKFIYSVLFLATFSQLSFSQVIKIEPLSSGLLFPVGIHNSGLPADDRLFILEKRGRIKIIDRLSGVAKAIPFLDIYNKVYPVSTANDERGLLGLAFHPNYASNGYFYVHYTHTSGKTIIARYQVSAFPDTAMVNSEQVLLTIYDPYPNHNGGNLMFGPDDGYLYIALGDGGSADDPQNRAQNPDSLLGKILRIDVNIQANPSPPFYFSAPGNPFYGTTPGRDEIFDWGLRNPWRCSFDRMTHDMWIADVGQNRREEINFRSRCDTLGHNYGWRCYEGDTVHNISGCLPLSNYEFPVFVYPHPQGCSVTGGYVYRGGLEGGLFGKYLFTDYCQGKIWATMPNGSGGWITNQLNQSTTQINFNYSSWGEDVYGELYLAGVSSGEIYKVRDTACAPTAYINLPDTVFICGQNQAVFNAVYGTGLTYSWTITGGTWAINGGQGSSAATASPDFNSKATLKVTVSNGTCSAVSNSILLIPSASLSGLDTMYCTSSSPVALSGSPAGGSFSGPGVSGNIFDPNIAGAGTHTVYYTLADTLSNCNYNSSGCLITAAKTMTVSACTGIDEQRFFRELKIYPNPSNSGFNIEFYSPLERELELTVNDALGRTVYSHRFETVRGKQHLLLNLPDAAEGLYFLTMKTGQSSSVEKIFVKN